MKPYPRVGAFHQAVTLYLDRPGGAIQSRIRTPSLAVGSRANWSGNCLQQCIQIVDGDRWNDKFRFHTAGKLVIYESCGVGRIVGSYVENFRNSQNVTEEDFLDV
jgi:hypothetical protein